MGLKQWVTRTNTLDYCPQSRQQSILLQLNSGKFCTTNSILAMRHTKKWSNAGNQKNNYFAKE
jgi:hypothetical protein